MAEPDVGSPEASLVLQEGVAGPQDNRDELAACCQKLLNHADAIEILERLSGRGPTLADDAVDTLTTLQTTRDAKLYQLFLHDILRTSGPGFVLLVSGLGKQRVARLAEKERTGLVRWIKNNRDTIDSSGLQSLAKEYQVLSVNDCRLAQVAGGSRKRLREEAEPSSSSKKPNSARENVVEAAEGPVTQHGDFGLDRQRQWEMEVKATEALIGDIYELTVEDARTIAFSEHIRGTIWLTDTYYSTTRPLVTIPVSEELRDQLITSRLPVKVPEKESLC